MQPEVHEPSSQRTVALFQVGFAFRLAGESTDGSLAVLEVTVPPKTLVKPHEHSKEDEFTVVLEGTIGARIGDETHEALPAGTSIVKPRGVPHALWNVTDEPARILELVSPAGLEGYFEEVAPVLQQHGPEWTRRFDELAAKYGLTIVNEWVGELEDRYAIKL